MNRNFYNQKLSHQNRLETQFTQKGKRLSIVRLIVFFILSFTVLFAFSHNVNWGFIALFISLVIFAYLIYLSKINENLLLNIQSLIKVYQNEITIINGKPNAFGDGTEFVDLNHNFTNDLDIFGAHSLFNLLNRTVTTEGKIILAKWFSSQEINEPNILNRQKAIKELSDFQELRDLLLPAFFKFNKPSSAGIISWLTGYKLYFSSLNWIRLLCITLSVVTIIFLVISILFDQWGFMLILFVNYILYGHFTKKVNLLHAHISEKTDLIAMHVEIINNIANYHFDNDYINSLVLEKKGFSQIQHQLSVLNKMINHLDQRLNFFVNLPLNLFLFWDIHLSYKIENWLEQNKTDMVVGLESLAEFDALMSLSTLAFNHTNWVWPVINTPDNKLSTRELGHPLITQEVRITNEYSLDGLGRLDLITGSNMAGKSTFLKAIGINVVLAQVGCPVCASHFEFTPFSVYTSMKITDSIEDNLSTFHAELNRIKKMLSALENDDNCLLLMDELFRGTNSKDRHIGSTSLIKHIIKQKATGILATHDLALTNLSDEYPIEIKNYYFDIQFKDNDLYFDYKLKEGVCNTFNAAFLLRKIGLDIE